MPAPTRVSQQLQGADLPALAFNPTRLVLQVGGILRIAHCGGLHVPQLNKLIDAINFVARLLHRHIRWDTEPLGCVPSLSSIPSQEQRLLTDAMQVRRGEGAGGSGAGRYKVESWQCGSCSCCACRAV